MQIGRRISRPVWLTGPAAIVLVLVLLLGAVSLGLRLPGLGVFDPIAEESLGYGAISGQRFSPLREAFVDRVLGAPIGGPLGADTTARSTSSTAHVFEHGLTNDGFGDAFVVPTLPFTAVTNTQGATREPGESTECAPTGGTVWYRYTPERDTRLSADTFGTARAVALGVFSGTSLNDLRSLGCDSDVTGAAQLTFSAKAKRSYYVQITSVVSGGRLVFNLTRRGRTLLASEAGAPGDGDSGAGYIYTNNNVVSADGRYAAFVSGAGNLVPGDTNGQYDVFVRDLVTGRITRASVSSSGAQSDDGGDFTPLTVPSQPGKESRTVNSVSISADGRYVAFNSYGNNLVPGDTNAEPRGPNFGEDAFVHDMRTGRTTRVSVTSAGKQGTRRANGNPPDPRSSALGLGCCSGTAISDDGRYVAFASWWDDLVPNDTNSQPDVFVHDMRTGMTTRASVGTEGRQMAGTQPFMSGDGRYIGFTSNADDGSNQVFVHDVRTMKTVLASFTRSHSIPNGFSYFASISDDGRYVAYESSASNVVRGDTNGILDAFRADLRKRTVVRVSIDSSGREQSAPRGSNSIRFGNLTPSTDPLPSISGDGRFVTFTSPASNLVPNDTNGVIDVFVHDTLTGRTARASVSTGGQQGDANSVEGVLSRHGGLIVFSSLATNLGDDDTNGYSNVFVRELILD